MSAEFARLQRAFRYAWAGVLYLFRNEPNARIHLGLAIIACVLAWLLAFSAIEWAILTITIATVFVAEAMNTAIEALTDLASPEINPQAAVAKDVAAGGVLLAALMSVIVALFLYIPKLVALVR